MKEYYRFTKQLIKGLHIGIKLQSCFDYIFRPGGWLGAAHNKSTMYKLVLLLSIVAPMVACYFVFMSERGPEGEVIIQPVAVVLLVSMLMAVASFFVTVTSASVAAKRKHTIDVLFSTRMQNEHQKVVDHMQRTKEWMRPEKITFEEYKSWCNKAIEDGDQDSKIDQRNATTARGLQYLLNYYEFLAAGICTDDLDEDLLRRTVRGYLVNLVAKVEPIIREHRTAPNDQNGGAELTHFVPADRIYCHLVYVFNRWNEEGRVLDLGPDPIEALQRKTGSASVPYDIRIDYKKFKERND